MTHSVNRDREAASRNRKKISGFTLIELITVIVILSILAVIGSGFVARTAETYQRTQARALLVNTARPALERMTRQLRVALPFSVRLTNSGSCIEFIPIVAAGNYFDPVSDQRNLAPASATIAAAPFEVNYGTARFITIGAMADNEIYGAGAASRAGFSSYTGSNITLNAAQRWARNSINKRYYVLDNPQAFCLVGGELRFYDDLNINDLAVPLTGSFSVIARNINANTPFSISAGNENRNMAIDIALGFSSGGERITYNHRVLIRNVP